MAKRSPIPKGPRHLAEKPTIDEGIHAFGRLHFTRLAAMRKKGMSRGTKERTR